MAKRTTKKKTVAKSKRKDDVFDRNHHIHHHHHHADPRTDEVLRALGCVLQNLERIMAKITTFNELLDQVNTVTNTIAANVLLLLDQRAKGGLTEDEEAQIETRIREQLATLQDVAANSSAPVPEVPPVEPV